VFSTLEALLDFHEPLLTVKSYVRSELKVVLKHIFETELAERVIIHNQDPTIGIA
jgi:hypothetical protein